VDKGQTRSVDPTRIYVIGYSLGAGGAEGAAGVTSINQQVPFFGMIAPGYVGSTSYTYMASQRTAYYFFHCRNDPTAQVSFSVNYVNNLNANHPLIPVQFYEFEDFTGAVAGANQHDKVIKAVVNQTTGIDYPMSNGDTWTSTNIIACALQFSR
jgi:predicted peptidase